MSYTPPSGSVADLIFAGAYTPPAGNAVDLNFDLVLLLSRDFSIAATLDDVTAVASFNPVYSFSVSTSLDDVGAEAQVSWTAEVFRGLSSVSSLDFSEDNFTDRFVVGSYSDVSSVRSEDILLYSNYLGITQSKTGSWFNVPDIIHDTHELWSEAIPSGLSKDASYSSPAGKQKSESVVWSIPELLMLSKEIGYNSPPRKALAQNYPWDVSLQPNHAVDSKFGVASNVFKKDIKLPWEESDDHPWYWVNSGDIVPLVNHDYVPSPDLAFYQTQEDYTGVAVLQFSHPCFAWPLHNRQKNHTGAVTIVLHTVKVLRWPDGVNVPAESVSMQMDIDSWCWGVSINLKSAQAMALLEPINGEPCQVRIEVDGIYITALIEQFGSDRRFGENRYTASGRSTLALLSQPFAPLRSRMEPDAKTAAQLVDYELSNTGWSVLYHPDLMQLFTTDWLVGAGAWSYQNRSPVDAILQVVRAVGARAYADKSASLVHVAPRYPVNPWDWADVGGVKSVRLGLVRSISTQLAPKPIYNQVYVSGQSQGVIVSAKRAGSAGDKPAPMVSDALISVVEAGRERARNILCDVGRQARITIELPLNGETGLLEPGQLIELQESTPWRGLATGITINAALGSVSQQVEIERHYE